MAAITMKIIAEKAGVSQPTASRILSGALRVTKLSHQRVLEVAREYNYKPNYFARSLKKGKTSCIGLMGSLRMPNFDDPYFNAVSAGVEQRMTESDNGYSLLVFGANHYDSIPKSLDLVDKGMLDGLIMLIPGDGLVRFEEQVLPVLQRNHLPFVAIHSFARELPYNTVTQDLAQTGYLAARYLLQREYTDLRIYKPTGSDPVNTDICRGFEKAVREKGLEFGPGNFITPATTSAGLYKDAYNTIHGLEEIPRALFVTGAEAARGAYDALVHKGAWPGRYVEMIGSMAETGHDPDEYTMVRYPLRGKGAAALGLLLDLLNGTRDLDQAHGIVLKPRLVIRRSDSR